MIRNKDQLIKNGANQKLRKLRTDVITILEAALESVDPKKAILSNIQIEDFMFKVNNLSFYLKDVEKIIVIGGGKAGGSMAFAIEQLLGERITGGVINLIKKTEDFYQLSHIKLHGAGHPIPDEEGLSGVKEMLKLVENLSDNDLVIILISGGGSSMMPLPSKGINLSMLQDITYSLLRSGATIREINTVRKHLSAIKGGQLAKACYPARVLGLILSDVVGDALDTIASGLTTPDKSTFISAREVLEKYGLLENASLEIKERIRLGCNGEIPDTPKKNDPIFKNVYNVIIANNATAALTALDKAKELGYNAQVFSTFIEGEAKEVGKVYSSIIKEISHSGRPIQPPCAIILGGETTVTVKGRGKGGRNQELALSSVRKIKDINCVLATIGTDGIDGGTKAAGAIIDGMSFKRGERKKQKIEDLLKNNNSNNYFKILKDLIITGPTGTNVNDLTVILVRQ